MEFDIKSARAVVREAERNSTERHRMWQALEYLFRTGMAHRGQIGPTDVPLRLWGDLPGLTLDAINFALPHVSLIMETVAAKDPEVNVVPYTGGEEAEVTAKVGQGTLYYWWKRLKITKRVARSMTQDAAVLGNGFCKVGWDWQGEDQDRDEDAMMRDLEALLVADQADRELTAQVDPETGEVSYTRDLTPEDELVDRVMPTQTVTLKDEPYVEYVSPFDIFVPENARRMEETPWVAQRIVMLKSEAEELFSADVEGVNRSAVRDLNTFGRDDSSKHRSDEEGQYSVQGNHPEHDERVEFFEFYDMRNRKQYIFQRDGEEFIYEGDLPYSHRHPPFVHMRGFDDGGTRFWAFGVLENIASLQWQVNELWTEQLANARRSGNKYLIDKQYLTHEVRQALESDLPEQVVPVEGLANVGVDQIIKSIERKPLPPDIYQGRLDAEQAMVSVLGLNDFQTGGVGADRMSATAAAVVDGTATIRSAGMRESVETTLAQMGLVLLLLCQEFMAEGQAVRIAGPKAVAWLDVTSEDLFGEFDVEIKVGSTAAVNPSTRAQRAMEIANTLLPIVVETGHDPAPLVRHIVRESGFDPDIILQPLPQPEMLPPGEGGAPAGSPIPGSPVDAIQPAGGPPEADLAQQGGGVAL